MALAQFYGLHTTIGFNPCMMIPAWVAAKIVAAPSTHVSAAISFNHAIIDELFPSGWEKRAARKRRRVKAESDESRNEF